MARRDTRADPFVQSSYYVDLVVPDRGGSVGFFGKVTGGSISLTVIEYTLNQYGGSQGIYIPGATAFEPVTLSQGVGTNMTFWNWWVDIANGQNHTANRINASIIAYGPVTDEATSTKKYAQWDLTDAWPSKISGFNFAATGDRVFGISVTLMVEEITRVEVP